MNATRSSVLARSQAAILDSLCEGLPGRVDPSEVELAATFCRLYLAKAPPEFFQERPLEALVALVAGSYRHLQEAGLAEVDVRVGNPSAEDEGWEASVTVIRTRVSERPFIVDTIREYLHSRDLSLERFLHPVLRVVRDEGGRVVELGHVSDGEPRESLVYCEVPRIREPDRLEEIRATLTGNLQDVVRATDDFKSMLAALDDTVAYLEEGAPRLPDRSSEIDEIKAFLRWLRGGAFVFLGYRAYDIVDLQDGQRAIVAEPGSGLGILRNEAGSSFSAPVPLSELSPGLRERVAGGPLLITSKTNASSTVHRRVRMDYIGIKKLDSAGRVTGERRFIGLFTSAAYSEDAERIPILREKLRTILEEAGGVEGSHDYKEIITIFNSMPKEELFLTSAEQIGREIQAALTFYHTQEVRVTMRPDPLSRGLSLMVIMPKEKFSGEVRKEVEDALVERLEGEVLNYHLSLGGGDQARLHFYISTNPEAIEAVDTEDLEGMVRRLIRSWTDRVRSGLEKIKPADEARTLAERYGMAFSPEYRAAIDPDVAAQDILTLEQMAADGRGVALTLSNPEIADGIAVGEPVTKLKFYLRDERLVLSDFMPILENTGLRVIAMSPFEVLGPNVPSTTIYVFAVQDAERKPLELVELGGLLVDAILAARAGDATSDPLNALVLTARLHWRRVDLLRAYSEYAFQLGAVPSRLSLLSALRGYPDAARLLVKLFATRFDPDLALTPAQRRRESAAIQREFIRSLEGVTSLADDRALRRLLALVDATVRTNYYSCGGDAPTRRSGGVPYISLKFAGEKLDAFARSRLMTEVWVHSSRMAGIHLRGARVARGGIRYSDRPDDFRSEVLGLVRTQSVKNAVIVPAGSKGGFITRRVFADRDRMAAEVLEQYRTLIRGLLDITDNLVGGEEVHPADVEVYDEPDPYLVVAADKGTAHLSDVANDVAAEYGYWLGDAFASGGSNGYDHKAVGITARGAWECVRRHFREMGRDIQIEPFTVVGIGDMGGDVFGNGMLLSRQIRLLAAFDHRHIFIDPDPDPEVSFRERERLFSAGRTTWEEYDPGALSEGGFIVPRGSKEVRLTPGARAALGIEAEVESLDGESLIQAILEAPADLLWNGGIGTYVKASSESHADVGDTANDAVRIDAASLRAQVIGEGGNLGLTQLARIEAALAGVRLNTDALDNAGGVDMSDREVNLKILLNHAVAEGGLDLDERNRLLEKLTGPVTELVLRDSRSQSLAVSLDQLRAGSGPDDLLELISALERERLLDRRGENLPSTSAFAERRAAGDTLTRPELSVLLSYAKLSLKQRLVLSDLPDDDAVASYLVSYFPVEAVQSAGEGALTGHRLRREIIASQLTNDLVDLMGAGFVHRLVRDSGSTPVEIARAWLITARLCGARPLRETLAGMEGEIPSPVIYRWLRGLARVLERTTRWVLANVSYEAPAALVIDQHLDGLSQLRAHFGEIVAGEERGVFEERVREMQQLTEKHDLAQRLITLRFLDQLLEILRIARETEADPLHAGRAYYLTSELLHVQWVRRTLSQVAGEDRWEQRTAQAIADDLGRAHRLLTRLVVEGAAAEAGPEATEESLSRVREQRTREIASYLQLVEEIQAEGPTLAALAVTVRELQSLGSRPFSPR